MKTRKKHSLLKYLVTCIAVLLFAVMGVFSSSQSAKVATQAMGETAYTNRVSTAGHKANPTAPNADDLTVDRDTVGTVGANVTSAGVTTPANLKDADDVDGTWLDREVSIPEAVRTHNTGNNQINLPETMSLYDIVNHNGQGSTNNTKLNQAQKYKVLSYLSTDDGNFFPRKSADGDVFGTEASPYLISNAKEFSFLGAVLAVRGNSITEYNPQSDIYADSSPLNFNGKYFKLDDNIDFAGAEVVPLMPYQSDRQGSQNLYFDGNGKTLSNIYIDKSADYSNNYDNTCHYESASIFGSWSSGYIKNLTVSNANIIGNYRAATIVSYYTNNNLTNLENISVVESRVVSKILSAGVATQAASMINCSIDNTEVIVTDIEDGDTYLTGGVMNNTTSKYAMGLGQANTILMTKTLNENGVDWDNARPAVSNSVVAFADATVEALNNKIYTKTYTKFEALTTSRGESNYILGIGKNAYNQEVKVGGFALTGGDRGEEILAPADMMVIRDSKVLSDLTVIDSKTSVAEGSYFNASFTNYVFGGYMNSFNQSTAQGAFANMELNNCEVKSIFSWTPSTADTNANMHFTGYNIAIGLAETYDYGVDDTYNNLVTNGSTLLAKNVFSPKNPTPANQYRDIGTNAYVAGVISVKNSEQFAVNCRINNSVVEAIEEFTLPTNNKARPNSTHYVGGIEIPDSNHYTKFYGCSVTNTDIKSTKTINTAGDTDADIDYDNRIWSDQRVVGIGVGSFESHDSTPCSVTNTKFDTTLVVNREEGDNWNYDSMTQYVAGFGYTIGAKTANFDNSLVKNVEMNISSKETVGSEEIYVGTIWAAGMNLLMQNDTNGTFFIDAKVDGLKVVAKASSLRIAGMSASGNTQTGIDGRYEFEDITIEDIYINAFGRTHTTVAGVVVNTNSNRGINIIGGMDTIEDGDSMAGFKRIKLHATTLEGISNVAGLLHNESYLSINSENFGILVDNIVATDFDLEANTITSYARVGGLVVNVGNYGNMLVENATLNTARVYSSSERSWATSAGIIINTGNRYGSSRRLLSNVSVSNADILATGKDLYDKNFDELVTSDFAKLRHASNAAGLAYNEVANVVDVENAIIDNSTIISTAVNGASSAAGVLLNRGSVATESTNNVAQITNSAVFDTKIATLSTMGEGVYAGSEARAAGIINNTSNAKFATDTTMVENSDIIARSNTNYAWSAGHALQSSSYGATVQDAYSNNNSVIAHKDNTGNGNGNAVAAYGIAGHYVSTTDNAVNAGGEVRAYNAIGSAWAAGVTQTYWLQEGGNRGTATEDFLTFITDSYNFATVSATTESQSNGYASGIGQAEYIDSCYNAGTVTGNWAGGISFGYSYNSDLLNYDEATKLKHSTPLTIKNSTNAGDIFRADNGSQSYIGGLVGIYHMNNLRNANLVLENNVSMGGVYSDSKYNQVVSPSTFLGTLYGYLTGCYNTTGYYYTLTSDAVINETEDFVKFASQYTIRGNYSLVEENGKNAGLYRDIADNPKPGALIGYKYNIPNTNYVSSSDGVFYCSRSVLQAGTTNQYRYDDTFIKLYKYATTVDADKAVNTNTIFTTTSNEDFVRPEALDTYAADNGWRTLQLADNTVPQVATDIMVQIVNYDLYGSDGNAPSARVYIIEDNKFDFTPGAATINEYGTSVVSWSNGARNYVVNDPYVDVEGYSLPVMTLYAVKGYTNYNIEFENSSNTNTAKVDNNTNTTFTVQNNKVELNSVYNGAETVNSVAWAIYNPAGSGSWDTLAFAAPADSGQANIFDISDLLTREFIEKYQIVEGSEYTLKFNVIYATTPTYTFEYDTASDSTTNNYKFSATVAGSSVLETNAIQEGQTLTLGVTPDDHYKFVSYTINGDTYSLDNGVINNNGTYTYTIRNVTEAVRVSALVVEQEYAININLVNIQNVNLPSDNISTLIKDYSTVESTKISIGEKLPQISANTTAIGYRFVGWKLIGMDATTFIPSTDGKIDADYSIATTDFGRYIANNEFTLIAVFQRQYTLNISMNNPVGASFMSTYRVEYTDENGVVQNLTNIGIENGETVIYENGQYIIDENTFIKVHITPNKRVKVDAPSNSNVEFGGNTAYIYLTDDVNVEFVFTVRPLDVDTSVLSVENPNLFEGRPEGTLISTVEYTVTPVDGTDPVKNPGMLNIGDTIVLGYNASVINLMKFRYVGVYLLNIITNEYDLLNNNTTVVNDTFFDKYVTNDGVVAIMLKVIKQYEVTITGENLVSTDSYNLGSYTVAVKAENGEDLSDTTRYTVIEANKKYLVDTGLKLEVTPNVVSKFAHFDGYTGLFEGEEATSSKAVAVASSDRAIALRFEKNTYKINSSINATVGGELSGSESFQLGDTITLSYTPKNNYQILDWTLAGKTLSDLGAERSGNTVKVVATEEFMNAMFDNGLLEGSNLTLNSEIETMMNPALFWGLIVGAIVILLLAGLVTLLLIRQSKLKKQKEEQERKLNDIARKFNIGNLISDLKAGKDVDFGQKK